MPSARICLRGHEMRSALLYAGQRAEPLAPGRSVPLAFALSAVVPGLGQAYNRQWIRGAAALGLELAVVAAYGTWRSQGLQGRDEYQAMAHQYWSPLRYARWLNEYVQYLNVLPDDRPVDASPIAIDAAVAGVDFSNPGGWTEADQLLVRRLILEIQAVERRVYHPETGAAFSHQLPFFGEQQYYELVGKYFQFAPGWEDYSHEVANGAPTWIDADGNYLVSIDPELTAADGTKPNVSSTFYQYADKHGSANALLRRASRISILFFVNHLLAAVEAAVSARLHNRRLETRMVLLPGSSEAVRAGVVIRLRP